jgi:hypothetical protein
MWENDIIQDEILSYCFWKDTFRIASDSVACNILYHMNTETYRLFVVCLLQLNLGYALLICSCYVDYIAIIYLTRISASTFLDAGPSGRAV